MKKFQIPNKNSASAFNFPPLTEETIRSLQDLGEVYRQIYRRLISEGYIFQNGKFIKPGPSAADNGANQTK